MSPLVTYRPRAVSAESRARPPGDVWTQATRSGSILPNSGTGNRFRRTAGATRVKILIVDDEVAIRDSLDLVLRFEHHEVILAEDGEKGLAALAADPTIDLTFLDIKMPGRDGLEVLADVMASARTGPLVVMISGHGTIDTAVEATRRGAFDFLEKPLDRERVLLTVRNAPRCRRLAGENDGPARDGSPTTTTRDGRGQRGPRGRCARSSRRSRPPRPAS